MLLNPKESCLVVIDVQEKLAPVVFNTRQVLDGCARLIKAARIMEVPTIATEQYPKGLGATAFDIRDLIPSPNIFEKMTFSAAKNQAFMNKLASLEKKQVVLAGLETHICVLQTAVDLKAEGFDVFVVADACSTRMDEDRKMADHRLRQSEITVCTIEMVIYEWLQEAGTDQFKAVKKSGVVD